MVPPGPGIVLAFRTQYFDDVAKLVREFRLNSFEDGTLELLEGKSVFLKRVFCPRVQRERLFVGSVVNVYGRALEVVAPADEGTRSYLETSTSVASASLEVSGGGALGALMEGLEQSFACIKELRSSSPSSIFVEVYDTTGPNAKERLKDLADSTRGIDYLSEEETKSVVKRQKTLPVTLCIVKPHVIEAKKAGALVSSIADGGFEIADVRWTSFDAATAEALFAVYKGIWPRYDDIIAHLLEGPCCLLCIRASAEVFADFCGPPDASLAKVLRPKSIRANFGQNAVNNALHCTDMDDDGPLETHFFFN